MEIKLNKDLVRQKKHIEKMLNNTVFDRRDIKKTNKTQEEDRILPEQLEKLNEFDRYNTLRKLSLHTRRVYLTGLRQIGLRIKKPFDIMTRKDLEDYILSLEGLSDKTIVNREALLKLFFKWFYTEVKKQKMKEDEFPEIVSWIKIKRNGVNALKKQLLTEEEILKIADASDNMRDRALILVLYETGGRASEISSIDLKDCEFDEYGVILTVVGKTGERKIRITNNKSAYCVLKEWYNSHPFKNNPDSPMFICISRKEYGTRLTRDGIYNVLKGLAKRAGVNGKRIYVHLLRHTKLTHMARDGYQESFLRKFAGWSGDSSMPKVYIDLSNVDMDKIQLEKEGILKKEQDKDKLKTTKCPKCKEDNSVTNKFCSKCATSLSSESAREIIAENIIKEIIVKKPEIQKAISKAMDELGYEIPK